MILRCAPVRKAVIQDLNPAPCSLQDFLSRHDDLRRFTSSPSPPCLSLCLCLGPSASFVHPVLTQPLCPFPLHFSVVRHDLGAACAVVLHTFGQDGGAGVEALCARMSQHNARCKTTLCDASRIRIREHNAQCNAIHRELGVAFMRSSLNINSACTPRVQIF